MSRLLTNAERERFAGWLEAEALDGAQMAKTMEENKLPLQLIEREKREAAAALIIARKLRSTESMSIG